MDWASILRDFVILLVVINPVSTISAYLFAVQGTPNKLHRRIAVQSILIAAFILLALMIGGQALFEILGLRLGSFRIASGVILFLLALTMIFGKSKPNREIEEAKRDHPTNVAFPVAMPSIASPGAILAIVMLTNNDPGSLYKQAITAGLLLLVLALTLTLLLSANIIHRTLGNSGAAIINRIMGIILATIAIDVILSGLDALIMLTVA